MSSRTRNITWDGPSSWDGVNASYWRLKSDQKVIPPYTFSGKVRLHEIMNPPVFDRGPAQGQTAWYRPALNFHPLYPSNERNIVMGIGARDRPEWVGISAEMRDVRPDTPYGVRTGYERKVRNPVVDPMDGQWHSFRCEVLSTSHYQLWWDDELIADVIEKEPATIDYGPISVGLRLDFCHIDLADMKVTQNMTVHQGTPRQVFDIEPVRILDTRETGARLKERTPTLLLTTGRPPAEASAVLTSLVAVNPSKDGFLTLWDGGPLPGTSNLNFQKGKNTTGFAIVPISKDGNIFAYASSPTDLVIDMMGYLA